MIVGIGMYLQYVSTQLRRLRISNSNLIKLMRTKIHLGRDALHWLGENCGVRSICGFLRLGGSSQHNPQSSQRRFKVNSQWTNANVASLTSCVSPLILFKMSSGAIFKDPKSLRFYTNTHKRF